MAQQTAPRGFRVTLKNDFHNTEFRLSIPPGGTITQNQVSRAKRALCGVRGCFCSNETGARGLQFTETGARFHIEQTAPDAWRLRFEEQTAPELLARLCAISSRFELGELPPELAEFLREITPAPV